MVSIRAVVVVLVVVVLAGLGVFFITSTPGPTAVTTPATTPARTETQTPTPTPTPTPTRTPSVVSLTLYMNDYGYNASRGGPTIRAFVGDLIRIRLIGNGTGPIVHDFVLDEKSPSPYNVRSERLPRGREQTIEFIATHAGVFKYYCSVAPPVGPSHRDRGQEGTIEILQR